jgi:hypothetical protein
LLNLILQDAFTVISKELDFMMKFLKSHRTSAVTRAFLAEFNDGKTLYFPKPVRTRWMYQYVLLLHMPLYYAHFSCRYHLLEAIVKQSQILMEAKIEYPRKSANAAIPGGEFLKGFVGGKKVRTYAKMVDALNVLVLMMTTLEGESYPTLSYVQAFAIGLFNQISHMESEPGEHSETLVSFYKKLSGGLSDRFLYKELTGPEDYIPVDYIAQILDPRTKDLVFFKSEREKEVIWNHVNGLVLRIVEKELSKPEGVRERVGSAFDLIQVKRPAFQQKSQSRNSKTPLYSELHEYRYGNGTFLRLEENPLEWWRSNERYYPHLAQLAKIYLAIPASSATVERLFSCAGLV